MSSNTNAERLIVLPYVRCVIVGLEQFNVVFYTMKPAVIVEQSCFCLLQTFTDVLLFSP